MNKTLLCIVCLISAVFSMRVLADPNSERSINLHNELPDPVNAESADSTQSGDKKRELREEISVIGVRGEQPQSLSPRNVALVGRESLQILGATHAAEVLRQIPGVYYHRGDGQESLPAIRSAVLTGAGACGNVLVMENVVPVRGAGFCNVNELFDTHYEQAEQVEVVRGAGTAFYGSNALLGSINVNLPVHGIDRLSVEIGPHGYRRAKVNVGYHLSDAEAAGRLYVTATDDDGFRDESGYDQQKVSVRQAVQFGDWRVLIGGSASRLDQETAGFIVGEDAYLDPAVREQNLNPEAFRKTDSKRFWSQFSKPFGNRELVITPYWRDTKMDFLLHFLPGDPLEQNSQQGFGWQSALTTIAADNFKWTVGVDAEFTKGKLTQSQEAPTQGSAFLRATIPTGIHYNYVADSAQFAAFAHTDWQVTPRWRALIGGRVETLRYDYNNLGLDGRTKEDGTFCGFGGCRYSRPADRQDDFTHFSPKFELQYQAAKGLTWHIILADSFRAPQATELYRLQRAQTQANLDEVRAMHIETGVRWQTEKTDFAVSLYQIDQSNVIIRDSDFFNVGGQKIDSRGLELFWHQTIAESWRTRIVASYAKHKYASNQVVDGVSINGNIVDTAPELVASAFLNWQVNAKLSAEVELHHVSDYFLEPNNRFSYPGHTLWHVRANYKISDTLAASVRLLNVADKFYAERADFTSFTDQRYFPGEPRSLFAELSWKF